MAEVPVEFIVPGPLSLRSGGTRYDRRMIEELRRQRFDIRVVELPGTFPFADCVAVAAAGEVIRNAPDGATLIIDGLALPAFRGVVADHTSRLRIVALIHHPLAQETGLSPQDQRQLFEWERDCLRYADTIVTTSESTALSLAEYGVGRARCTVVLPGTDMPPASSIRSSATAVRLLCVAAFVERKGHAVLLAALSHCRHLPWRLDCFGSLDRDPAIVAGVQKRIDCYGFQDRVFLHGEADDAQLTDAYQSADVFALASALEGYGMAFAEAMAHGLPVVGSGAGAVRDTVPEAAGLIVPVGDVAALSRALTGIIGDPALRSSLAAGAREAAGRLPSWPQSATAFGALLNRQRDPVR